MNFTNLLNAWEQALNHVYNNYTYMPYKCGYTFTFYCEVEHAVERLEDYVFSN